MLSRILKYLGVFYLLSIQTVSAANVALLVMATGKYIVFAEPLFNSARRYFCPGHQVTFFVFTDKYFPPTDDVVCIYQAKLGWPFDTLKRYHAYLGQRDLLAQQDYIYACDVDMLFVDTVGDEILGERVATLSPGFVKESPFPRVRGAYDTNPLSTACVRDDEGEFYFAGGFYGGTSEEFIKILETNVANIDIDLQNGIIAEWHDESHWNRYCIDHKPTIILSPSYCYPENWQMPYHKRLLALDKNHAELRTDTTTPSNP